VKNIFRLLFLSIVCFSCDNKPENKGDIIPPYSVLKNPINTSKTLEYLTALIEENESNQLYYLRAKVFFELHEYTKAYKDIQKAIKGGSDDLDFIFLSALIKYHLEWYDDALQDLTLFSTSNFNSDLVNQLLVQIYLAKNDFKKANYFLSKMNVKNSQKREDILLSKICFGDINSVLVELNSLPSFTEESIFLTRFYFQNYKPNKLDYNYQYKLLEVLKLHPSDPHLMRFWARFLSSVKKIERAEKVYLQVEKMFPKNPIFPAEIGEFYFNLKKYIKARDYFTKVPRNSSSHPKALFYKSVILIYYAEKEQGLKVLDSLKILYPNEIYLLNIFGRYTKNQLPSNYKKADSLRSAVNQN